MIPFSDIDTKRLKGLTILMGDQSSNWWQDRYPWRSWFAWRPVQVRGKWAWLKKVYRREIPKTYVNHDDWTRYDYGDIFEVLKDERN